MRYLFIIESTYICSVSTMVPTKCPYYISPTIVPIR